MEDSARGLHQGDNMLGKSAQIPRNSAGIRLVIGALEVLLRLSVPASVLLLSRGSTTLAAWTSAVALVSTAARSFVTSIAIERGIQATFDAVVRAGLQLSLVDLRAERKIGLLTEAARESAVYEATVVPQIGAFAVAIVITWGALLFVLGPLWVLALSVAVSPLVVGLVIGAKRIRAEQEAAWSVLTDLAIELRVLVEACVELCAHERQGAFADSLVAKARTFAAAERRANVWSAVSTSVPSAVLFLSATTPLGRQIGAIVENATGRRAAEIAISAGAALYFAVGLGKLLESRARYAPLREILGAFLASAAGSARLPESRRTSSEHAECSEMPPLVSATIRFRDVCIRHPNAVRATPEHASFTWKPGRGLVLTGKNGAGKSSLILALLGLLRPTSGAIEIDGPAGDGQSKSTEITGHVARTVRERCAYLSQSPFVEPGASVAFHLRLFARKQVDDAHIDAALRRSGLWPILEEHVVRGASSVPRDVPAGELSGGELQRMHLARALVEPAELLIFDEPEAGLDPLARTEIKGLFEELAKDHRVLIIAHDPAILPSSFERFEVLSEVCE